MAFNGRRIWKVIRIVWVILGVASPFVLLWGMSAANLPPGALVTDARVEIVRADDTINFRPRPDDPSKPGLIFFPGGMVAPEAYAPMARRLAERGHHVVIVRLPYRLAPTHAYHQLVFQTAVETLTAPARPWVIGGHSRGGKLAAEFVSEHPAQVAGLALIGTTHPREIDLSKLSACVPVLKVSGSNDGIAPVSGSAEFQRNLPPHTRHVVIDGANHTQFGYYRFQLLDKRPSIDRETQQAQLVDALLSVLATPACAGAHP